MPPPLQEALAEVMELLRRKHRAEAANLLEELDQRYPRQPDVLFLLEEAYDQLKDHRGGQSARERRLQVQPDDPLLLLALADDYAANMHLVLARRTLRRFLERWPEHPEARHIRQVAAELDEHMDVLLDDIGLAGPGGLELAEQHEEAQALLNRGQFDGARRLLEQLLRRRPDYAPALNNLSQAHFLQGRPDQAIATARKVLAFAPDNFHALGNLVRFLCLDGQFAAAGHTGILRSIIDRVTEVETSLQSYLRSSRTCPWRGTTKHENTRVEAGLPRPYANGAIFAVPQNSLCPGAV